MRSATLESDNNYKKVHITIQLSEESNRLLSESAKRSKRKKIQEAMLRIEDHLNKYQSISELNHTVPKLIKGDDGFGYNQKGV